MLAGRGRSGPVRSRNVARTASGRPNQEERTGKPSVRAKMFGRFLGH